MRDFLTGLNPEQRAAVEHGNGPLLVLAGAGSGKTRVITHRIAHLLERGVRPWNVFAVTFTNKAAGEMLERVEKLVGEAANDVWVSTFHAAGVRILRRDGYKIGLPRNFTILDDGDQLTQMKRVMKELDPTERVATAKDALHRVDHWKNQGLRADEVKIADGDTTGLLLHKAYRRYSDALAAQGAVDFGDLLLRVVELLKASPDTREHYRRKFLHLLVDEFQDTNPVQYELLRQLSPDERTQSNLCVVGDDDQAIYAWRGADVANILGFTKEYPNAAVVKLERNYRSTPRILETAHSVIARNKARAAKKLWTEGEPGDQVEVQLLDSDRGEAQYVAERVARERARGVKFGNVAVFYRTNAQSRLLEEALRSRHVPYVVVRGTSFYDRAEVKDVVAWLRLLANPRSDVAFLRAVAAPPRGIGETTLEKLSAYAGSIGKSLYEAIGGIDFVTDLNSGARTKLRDFRAEIDRITTFATGSAEAAVKAAAEETGLLDRLAADPRGEVVERQENVREFIRAARDFDVAWNAVLQQPPSPDLSLVDVTAPRVENPEATFGTAQVAALRALRRDADQPPPTPLEAFLAQVAVLGDADADGAADRVNLMTFHAAKGLEFDVAVMTGMEETVFPTARAMNEYDGETEERRLCYVGITRARKRLVLTLARSRALFGELRFNPPSRFLSDLPAEHVTGLKSLSPAPAAESWTSPRFSVPVRPPAPKGEWVDRDDAPSYDDDAPRSRPPPLRPPAFTASKPRAPDVPRDLVVKTAEKKTAAGRVRHKSFGEGRILATQGEGDSAKLTVHFESVGPKVVVAKYVERLD